jgi:hypothetical protein
MKSETKTWRGECRVAGHLYSICRGYQDIIHDSTKLIVCHYANYSMGVSNLVLAVVAQVWHLRLELMKHQPVFVVDVVCGELWKMVTSDSVRRQRAGRDFGG